MTHDAQSTSVGPSSSYQRGPVRQLTEEYMADVAADERCCGVAHPKRPWVCDLPKNHGAPTPNSHAALAPRWAEPQFWRTSDSSDQQSREES